MSDAVGHRVSRTATLPGAPTQANITVDANDRLTTDGYDANGKTVTAEGWTDVYDFENRLVGVAGSGLSIMLVYDGEGIGLDATTTDGAR